MKMKIMVGLVVGMLVGTDCVIAQTWTGSAGNRIWAEPDAGNFSSEYTSGSTATFTSTSAGTVTNQAGGVTPGAIIVASGAYTFTGGSIGGTGGLTINGTGSLILSGTNNTYSGTTTLTAGTLRGEYSGNSLTPVSPFGSSSLALNGGTLELRAVGSNNNNFETITFGNNVTVGGNVAINATRYGNSVNNKTIAMGTLSIGANTLTVDGGNGFLLSFSAMTLTGNATFNPNGTSITTLVLGSISDGANTFGITKSGGNVLQIIGNGSYKGFTKISGGTLSLGNGGTTGSLTGTSAITNNANLTVNRSNTFKQTIDLNDKAITGSGSFTQAGTGATFLSNTNNTYTGVTTISGGTLEVAKLANGGVNSSIGASSSAASNLVFGNGITLHYTGTGDSTDRAITFNASGQDYGFTINASGAGAVQFTNTAPITNTQTGGNQRRYYTLSGTNTGDNMFAGQVTQNGANNASLIKSGPGKWVITNTNSAYAGGLFIQGGTLEVRSGDSALTHTSSANLGTSVGEATLIANKAGAGTLTISLAGYTRNGSGSANIISIGGTNGDNNTINMTGAAGFINAGLFFGGSEFAARNALNGFIRALAYGTDASASAVNTIGSSTHVKLTSSPASQNNTTLLSLNLQGSGVDWSNNSGQTLTTPGILKSGVGSSTISGGNVSGGNNTELVIRTDTASDSLAISSILSQGSGALTKSGLGTLTLSGANTYTGQTHINAGTLTISANNNLGAEATGATLNLKGGTLQATGTFGLFNGTAGANNRAVTLLNQSTIEVTGANTLTIAGVISNHANAGAIAPGFNKTGTGTLVLSGANTYTGETIINGGKLALGGHNVLTGKSITINGGTLVAGAYTNTLSTLKVSGSGTIVMSPGTVLAFADSSSIQWGGTVNLTGLFTPGTSLRFGTSSSGLTPEQLASLTAIGYKLSIDGNGYLTGRPSGTLISFM